MLTSQKRSGPFVRQMSGRTVKEVKWRIVDGRKVLIGAGGCRMVLEWRISNVECRVSDVESVESVDVVDMVDMDVHVEE